MTDKSEERKARVLVIDNDNDIADIVYVLLSDEGYAVSLLACVEPAAIRVAVRQLEPDCVLLDGQSPGAYGQSWLEAAWMSGRSRKVPVIMFTVDAQAMREQRQATSERSHLAQFDSVMPKPFDLDELIAAVSHAVGWSVPFQTSAAAETHRTTQMRAKLEAAGAHDIHMSSQREWATFRTATDVLVQIYWWQRDGAYVVTRLAESGAKMEQIGRVYDLDVAIAVGMLAGQS